jgi:chromosome partitioning protein
MTMKVAVVTNQKGGVGKTTVARHLGFFGPEMGYRTCMIDLDVQGNLTTTCKNVAEAGGYAFPDTWAGDHEWLTASRLFDRSGSFKPVKVAENLHCVPADPGIVNVERSDLNAVIAAGQKQIARLGKDFDVCIVDTGPAVSNLLIVGLAIADFAVAPCKPDRDAIAGLAGFFSNVVRVRDETQLNPKLAPLGVLPNQLSRDRAYHRNTLAEMRAAWGDGVLPVQLHERAAIDLAKDRAVWRTDRGQSRSVAAEEMKAVCAYIYKRMGL